MTDSSDSSAIKNMDLDLQAGGSVASEYGKESEKLKPGDMTGETKETADSSKRFYALYSLHPHRNCTNNEENETQDSRQSLSVIATNLVATAEGDLRKAILSWLSKDKVIPGKGRFTSVGLNLESEYSSSAICYSSLVESPSSDLLGFDHVTANDIDDSCENRHQFVVSFVSFQDSSLDLFRSEFEVYVQGLVPFLDKEDPSLSSESTNNSASSSTPVKVLDLTQLSTGIQTYLEQWPSSVLGYLTRTLQYMGADIEHLIYAALLNASLQISGTTAEKEEDIKSLSSLMEQLQPDNGSHKSITGSSDSCDLWQLQAPVVSLSFTQGDQECPENGGKAKVVMNPAYTCTFCKNAAEKLMSLDPLNVTKIRDFLESIKLTFVHNLNKLKRFLKQAEVDYYALYRSLSYLKKCGCGELLVQYVKLDGGPETLNVLSALEMFIKDMNQNLS